MIFRRRTESPLWTKDDCIVRLSEAEMWKVQRLAHFRNDPKMEAQVPNHRICDLDDYEVHLKGLKAEYAVALYFAEPLDVTIDLHGDGNRADLFIGPWSAQVKYASHHPPYLKFNTAEEFTQDLAILAGPHPTAPRDDVVQLVGWTNRQHFLECHKMKNFGYGSRLYVGVEDLWPMRGLKVLLFDQIVFPQIQRAEEGAARELPKETAQ